MSEGTLLFGPSFSPLRSCAFSIAQSDAGGQPGSILWLDANDAVRDTTVERWTTGDARNALQLQVASLEDFVTRVHDVLHDASPQVGTLQRQRSIEAALRAHDGFDDGERYADGFSELLRELEAAGLVTEAALADRLADSPFPESAADDLFAVFSGYQEAVSELAHPDAMTRSEQFLTVAATGDDLAAAYPTLDHVIVSNYTAPAPVELAVIERITEAFPTTVVLPALAHHAVDSDCGEFRPTGTDTAMTSTAAAYEDLELSAEYVHPDEETQPSTVARHLFTPAATDDMVDATAAVTWHEAPTPDREVRHLARRLRQDLSAGTDPGDLMVLAPGLLSYRDRIEDVFDAYDVPFVAPVSILLERTLAGRAILDATGLCLDPAVDQLARLATNPVATLDGVDEAVLTDVIDRLPTDTVAGLHTYGGEELVDSVSDLLEQAEEVRAADGVGTLESIGALLDTLSIQANVEAFGERDWPLDVTTASEPLAEDPPVPVGYEQRAIQRVREIFESLVPVLEGGVPDPLETIERALQGVRVQAPPQSREGKVRVVGLEDTPMARYNRLYILGATQRDFGKPTAGPRYFQQAFEDLEIKDPDREWQLRRYRFGLLLANAETVHFTTPAETMAGEDVIVSPLLDEVTQVARIEETSGLDDEPRGSFEDIQRALAGREPAALVEPVEELRGDGVLSTGTATAMRTGAETGAARAASSPTPHDGQLETSTLEHLNDDLRRRPFSPSRLNTYAKCGFKYYVSKGLAFESPTEFSPDAGRFAIGDVVHKALETFFHDLIEDAGGPVALDSYDRATLEQRLLSAGERALEAVEEPFRSVFDQTQLRTLFAGLATPGTNEFFGATEPGDRSNGLFVSVLDRELGEPDWRPSFVETWFATEAMPDTSVQDGRVPTHGIIDRIDLQEGDGSDVAARVIDYKTYHRDATNAVRGLDFQLPSYVVAAADIVEEAFDHRPTDVDGVYRVVSPPTRVSHPASLARRVEWDLDADLRDFLREVLPEWLDNLRTGIESGAFQPAVVGADDAGCHNCEFARICDVRHHRRFEVIDALDRTDHPAYVAPGARPGDLADHVALTSDEGESK